jgi:hypothetical protein
LFNRRDGIFIATIIVEFICTHTGLEDQSI